MEEHQRRGEDQKEPTHHSVWANERLANYFERTRRTTDDMSYSPSTIVKTTLKSSGKRSFALLPKIPGRSKMLGRVGITWVRVASLWRDQL